MVRQDDAVRHGESGDVVQRASERDVRGKKEAAL